MRAFFFSLLVLGCSSAESDPPTTNADAATDSVTADSVTADSAPATDTATPDDAPIGSAASYADVYKKVLSGTCSSGYCHGSEAGGWSVKDEAATYAELVGPSSSQCAGLKRVEPGQPDKSALYLKLKGDFAMVCMGKKMPSGGMLNAGDLELVRSWIAAGAKR